MSSTKHKYIGRYDNYFRVRIRINKKEFCNKWFNINDHGGVRKTLSKAIEYRDISLKKHKLLYRLNYEKSPDESTSNGKTICIGISFTYTKQKNGPFSNWTARYLNEKKRTFSVNKYGYEQAFLMACKVRYKHCGPIKVLNKKALPCKPTVPYKIIHGKAS
jgi:hypothetical protein